MPPSAGAITPPTTDTGLTLVPKPRRRRAESLPRPAPFGLHLFRPSSAADTVAVAIAVAVLVALTVVPALLGSAPVEVLRRQDREHVSGKPPGARGQHQAARHAAKEARHQPGLGSRRAGHVLRHPGAEVPVTGQIATFVGFSRTHDDALLPHLGPRDGLRGVPGEPDAGGVRPAPSYRATTNWSADGADRPRPGPAAGRRTPPGLPRTWAGARPRPGHGI
ncbi:hypothetical protein AB0F64_08665 [Streptomyces sp. NPDC026294]|uniref:hypothetical protein n=1 Tax=Streptomyces sp. NPDC026294 TaxID=3155362 RepID=UPI0033D1B36D